MMIREAVTSDFSAIGALYQQLHTDDPGFGELQQQLFEQILATDRLTLLVGTEANTVVSCCYLNIIPNLSRGGAPYAIIENVVTCTQHRNQGHGKRIIRHALDSAWSRGCYKVMLQTGSKRESTHQFYQSCGFSACDKTAYVARPG